MKLMKKKNRERLTLALKIGAGALAVIILAGYIIQAFML